MSSIEASSQRAPDELSIVIGNQPLALPFKRGEIASGLFNLKPIEVDPIHTSFKPMVRELRYDICEMAIVTFLMAMDRGIPITLLPAVMLGRQQHPLFVFNADRGDVSPSTLAGKRVGVRAYSQTTGAWIRGMLGDDHGVSFKDINWVTYEDSHVPNFKDPEWTTRAPAEKTLMGMLKAGEIDAAIMEKVDDPAIQPVIPQADAVAENWARRHGCQPINHLVVVRNELLRQHPALGEEVYRVLKASKAAAPAPAGIDPMPFGVEANRQSLDLISRHAFDQGLVSRIYTTDDIIAPALRHLN